MTEAQKRLEIPYLSDTPLSFGLETPEGNAARLKELMSKQPTQELKQGPYILYHVGTRELGYYFLVHEGLIEYFVEHELQSLEKLGPFVAQVKLWRFLGTQFRNITDVGFDRLIKDFGTVVSDEAQTQDGRDFWLRQLAHFVNNGFEVGMIDENGTIEAFRDARTYNEWIMAAKPRAWGQDLVHMQRRFFIRAV